MNRRTALKVGGMAAVSFGLSGCGPRKAAVSPSRPTVALAPVHASWDRVIRTTVGLRPHRDSGFVLRAEKLDAKTVVHNYGHGGAGMSISWGTGLMAAEYALQTGERRAAVIGCGAVGLTCARQLQRRGFDVTMYAAAVHPDVTSSMSLAGFTPLSGLVDNASRTSQWDAQFMRAAQMSYRQLQLLAGQPQYGISWIYQYSLMDELRTGPEQDPTRPNLQAGLEAGPEILEPGEHPFATKYAVRRPELRIEPSIYLETMMRDVILFGGKIVIRKFDSPRDLMALSEPVIVNCTGLGAKALFGDEELIPLKGQLTVLVPQADVDYSTIGGSRQPAVPGQFGIHMMPRRDGIVLGGTSERGVWTMEPNEEARQRVVDSHIEVFAAMRQPRGPVTARVARINVPEEVPSLESHFRTMY